MNSPATIPNSRVRWLRPRKTLVESSSPLPHFPEYGQQLGLQNTCISALRQEPARHGFQQLQDPKWRTTGKTVANGLKLSRKCATLYGQRAGAKISSGRDACRRASGAKSTVDGDVACAAAVTAAATAAEARIARWGGERGRWYGAAASRRAWRPGRRGGFDLDVFGGGGVSVASPATLETRSSGWRSHAPSEEAASHRGAITKEDLKALLGQHFDLPACQEMIKKADADKDGKMNFDDFVKMMKLPASLSGKASKAAFAQRRTSDVGARRISGASDAESVVPRRSVSSAGANAAELASKEEALQKIESLRTDLAKEPIADPVAPETVEVQLPETTT